MYTSRFEDAQIAFIEAVKRYKPFAELVQVIEVGNHRKNRWLLKIIIYFTFCHFSISCRIVQSVEVCLCPVICSTRYREYLDTGYSLKVQYCHGKRHLGNNHIDYKKRLPEDHSDIENTKSEGGKRGGLSITILFSGALKAISEVAQHLDNRIKDLVWRTHIIRKELLDFYKAVYESLFLSIGTTSYCS